MKECNGLKERMMTKVAGLVMVVFQNEVNPAAGFDSASDSFRQLRESVGRGIVNDGVDRVQSEAIKVIFHQPIQRVVNEEIPNGAAFRPVEVDGAAPGSCVPVGKELWCVGAKVVSFRAEMVVNNI